MNREQLLEPRARRLESIEIEGIGRVHLRALTARESLALSMALKDADRSSADGLASLCATQLAAFICDEQGAPLLSIEDAGNLLNEWKAADVQRVVAKGKELNALDNDPVE